MADIAAYTDLITALGNWHQRSNLDSTTVLPQCIGLFEKAANRRLRVREMESTSTITMSSGSGTLPTDYLDWINVKYNGTPVRNLEFASRAYMTETYPTSPSGIPDVFTIEGNTIAVMPTTGTSLVMQYYAKIPALTSNATTNWLLTKYCDIYLFGTLLETNAFIRNPEMAPIWKARRDECFDEIVSLAQKAKAPGQIRPQGVPTP